MENYLSDENIISSFKCSKYLLNLAILSGKFSRFNVDRILRPKFEILYHTWLEKSVKREIADEVYSYIIDGKEIAFVTVKRTNEKALIGLIAVDSEYHGKKLGSKLIMVVEKWCMDNHIEILEVATQYNNSQACHFYKKNEFTIKQIDYVYHMYKK